MKLRRIALAVVAIAVVFVSAGMIMKARADATFFDGYNRETPLQTVIELDETREFFRWTKLYFDGLPGERVPTVLARPLTGDGPFPCVIFLHGIGQNKGFLEEIAKYYTDEGFAIVSFDQYTRGERRVEKGGVYRGIADLRRRAALNVLETRRLIDYLESRKDIAADRIYLNGASFGAITGSTAAAFEPRIRASVLTYGGGDIATLLASTSAEKALDERGASWLLGPLCSLGSYLFAPADPIRYVEKISPRPVLMQVGRDDSVVPMASGQKLYDAAKDPKELVIYEGDHIGLDEAHVVKVLGDSIAWMKKLDLSVISHANAESSAPTL